MMTPSRFSPPHDPNVLLLAGLAEPPKDPNVRIDFVRTAMAVFLEQPGSHRDVTPGMQRLANVLRHADEHRLKSILFAIYEPDEWAAAYDQLASDMMQALKDVAASGVWENEWLVRMAEIAADVLDFDMDSEWETYTRPNWWLLTDEVEFVAEEEPANYYDEYAQTWITRTEWETRNRREEWFPSWPYVHGNGDRHGESRRIVDDDYVDAQPSPREAVAMVRYDARFDDPSESSSSYRTRR